MAQLFAGMVVIGPPQREGAEDAVHADADTAFAFLTRLGLVTGVDPVCRRLKEDGD
jgi:hypothetical protein